MSEEKQVVDVTKLERGELEELILKLSSENNMRAEYITRIHKLNADLEQHIIVLEDRLLIIRRFTICLSKQVGLLLEEGEETYDSPNSV